MIEDRYVALIHAEIDGLLTTQQRAELSRYLLGNPEARALRDELRWMNGVLERIDPASPPADLAESILGAIVPAQPTALLGVRASARSFPSALRYAAVFAGGLLISAIALQLARHEQAATDVSALVGTMANPRLAPKSSRVDQIQLDLDQATGSVALYEVDSRRVLALDLNVRQPITVVAMQQGREIRVELPAGAGERGDNVFWMLTPGDAESAVDVKFLAAGQLVHVVTIGATRAN